MLLKNYKILVTDDRNNQKSSNSSETSKITTMNELKDLLGNEPKSIKENVLLEWKLIDDQVSQLVSLKNDEGIDEAFEKLSLMPDEFENETTQFIRKLQQTEADQETIEI